MYNALYLLIDSVLVRNYTWAINDRPSNFEPRRIQRVPNSPKMVANMIAKSPTWSPKMTPTWIYRQDFTKFPLNPNYNPPVLIHKRFNVAPVEEIRWITVCCQVIYSQFGLAIHQNDHQARRRFVEWAQNEIAVVPDFHKRILFSDEAHFWLNGYVNKQNCRIWSEAN
ncbi:hypothetical protein TNCV_3591681 [Trichonephila clavipes]|nr:hypothetical protein TNCV_3591681 [Trichonephila clavipes]